MIREKPVFGWGFNNFDYFNEGFKTSVGFIENQSRSTSHNTFLSIFAEMGFIGIFLYMLPVVWWFGVSLITWRRLPNSGWMDRSWLVIFWLFMLFHFTINNFIDMIRFHAFGNVIWWLGLAFIANIVTQPKLDNQSSLTGE
jgi:O-antigen ligase